MLTGVNQLGALLSVVDGKQVKAGMTLASWDPHHRPIIAEYAGTVKLENVIENITVAKQMDEVTGLSTLVVIDPKQRGAAPFGSTDQWIQ